MYKVCLILFGALAAIVLVAVSVGRRDRDPAVARLLSESAEEDLEQNSPFWKTFSELAKKQGLDPKAGTEFMSDGKAVEVTSDSERHVVVMLGSQGIPRPGIFDQHLILLDEGGKFLDRVSCKINPRAGALRTEMTKKKQEDGAQLVVWFVPENDKFPWHGAHLISYDGKTYEFSEPERPQPTDWDKKGLCRVAIKKRKFEVVFPKLDEEHLLKEKK